MEPQADATTKESASETTMVENGETEKSDKDKDTAEEETSKEGFASTDTTAAAAAAAATDSNTNITEIETATKRSRKNKGKSRKEWQQAKKKARTEKSKDPKKMKNKRNIDYNVDAREQPPQEGSFANEELRKQFGIELDSSLNIKIGEDNQSTTKKKVVLLLGFLGTKYWGFQANPRAHTIQAELELALWRAGLIRDLNFGQPNKVGFSMSARTDKGVHACAQVCSLKLELLPDDVTNLDSVRQRIQERLPDDIHVLDIQRTTRNFCAKTQRERVRYSYILPSFLLHPNYKNLFESLNIPMSGREDAGSKPLTEEEVMKLGNVLKDYRSTEEQRSKLKSALEKYEGTKKFHNFTRGIKAGQANANRYIEFFKMQDPIIIDGVEWIPTQVLGQSFLLHQIRKMISMAIDVARGVAPPEVMDRALDKEQILRVNVAPAQGLFLEMSYFTGYNRRKQTNPDLPDLDWNQEGDANTRWSEFRDKIRKHIIEEENSERNFIQYFYIQECIFEYRRFYKLDGNNDNDDDENGEEVDDEKEVDAGEAATATSSNDNKGAAVDPSACSDNKDS